MGYNTCYSLEIQTIETVPSCEHFPLEDVAFCLYCGAPNIPRDLADKINKEIEELVGFDPIAETCKWYEHEENMRQISAKYPNVLLTLNGVGEEPGDLWVRYFKNGKMQYAPARITYDEYDEKKLA